jgi:hypothetical protein
MNGGPRGTTRGVASHPTATDLLRSAIELAEATFPQAQAPECAHLISISGPDHVHHPPKDALVESTSLALCVRDALASAGSDSW